MKRHLNVKYLEGMIESPRVRYAQCWEDPRTLTEALAITQEDDVLSIAKEDFLGSAGWDGDRSSCCERRCRRNNP